MFVTLETSHNVMSELKVCAFSNINACAAWAGQNSVRLFLAAHRLLQASMAGTMELTRETSQVLMSALNDGWSLNSRSMFVIRETSHVPISPYCERAAASSETHRLTAVCS